MNILITVATTGAETAKADWPQLPTTLEELVAEAQACERAGASLVHVHIRDDEHRPTLDLGRLLVTVEALRAETDLVVQLSTGGACTTRSMPGSGCSRPSRTRAR